jgi:hypothetical protein
MNPTQQASAPMENQPTGQSNSQSIRAIKIDVFTQTIYPVILQRNDGSLLKSMYAAIGCQCIDMVRMATRRNEDLVVDDQALLCSDIPPAFDFIRNDLPQTICGNALVVGVNAEGETVSCLSSVEEIAAQVHWLGYNLIAC